MISLSINKPSSVSKDSSSAVPSPAANAPISASAVASARPKSAFGGPDVSLPQLASAVLESASKGPHGRRFGLGWLQLGRSKRRLQTLETVSLGDKRFIALVRVDGRQFLIGGAPSSVGLLTELAQEESFHQVLNDATQGMNISLSEPGMDLERPKASSEVAASPADHADELKLPADSVKLSAVPVSVSSKVADEAPLPVPSHFDETFLRAYRDIATNAQKETSPVALLPLTHSQSVPAESNAGALSEELQPVALLALPAMKLGPIPAPEPLLAREEHAPEVSSDHQGPATTKLSAAPDVDYQDRVDAGSKPADREDLLAPFRPAALRLAGFTWSWTGATS